MNAQRHTEAIEARSEVRSAGGNAHTVTDCILQAIRPKLETEPSHGRADISARDSHSKTLGQLSRAPAAMKTGWIDFGLVRDFRAEQTNAYRICTKPKASAERFGNDALVSFKTERDRDAIIDELRQWSEAGAVPLRASSPAFSRRKMRNANHRSLSRAIAIPICRPQ